MRWPLDQLLRDLGDSAVLLTAGGNDSLASRLQTWTIEVETCIDIPPGESGELTAFHDFWASVSTRDDIDYLSRELPGHVRDAIERWLRDGPDAEFVRLTEPDDGHLVVRAGIADEGDEMLWESRVPRRGLARLAIEHELIKNSSPPDPSDG